jgi:hypothetical protein
MVIRAISLRDWSFIIGFFITVLIPKFVYGQSDSNPDFGSNKVSRPSVADTKVLASNEFREPANSLSFHWKGVANCDSRERILSRVSDLISGSVESKLTEPLVVYAAIEHSADAMLAELTLIDKLGVHERQLEGATCDELVEAVALVLALAITPLLSVSMATNRVNEPRHSEERKSTRGSVLPETRTPPPQSGARNTTTSTERIRSRKAKKDRPVALAGMSAESRLGLFPGVVGGMGLTGGVERLGLAVSFSAVWLKSVETFSASSSRAITFDALLISPRLCSFEALSTVAVGPCVSTSLGIVWAHGLGIQNATPTRHGFGSSGLGISARFFRNDSAFVNLDTDVVVPWRRTRYVVDEELLYRANSVGGRLAVNVGLAW